MAKLNLGLHGYLYFEFNPNRFCADYNYFLVTIPELFKNFEFCFEDYKTQDIGGFIIWLKKVIDKDFSEESYFGDIEDIFEAEVDEYGDFNISLDLDRDPDMHNYVKFEGIKKENVKDFYLELKEEYNKYFGKNYKKDYYSYLDYSNNPNIKPTGELINSHERHKDYLCARARYGVMGKIYTFLVDKADDTCFWYTEGDEQEVYIEEFVYLNEDELPVPIERMKKLVSF